MGASKYPDLTAGDNNRLLALFERPNLLRNLCAKTVFSSAAAGAKLISLFYESGALK